MAARLVHSRLPAWLLLLCASLGTSCERKTSFRIAVVLDEDGARGAALAMQSVNAAGGINGHPLELKTIGGASSTSARIALEAAEQVASDPKILAVVGHTNSSASLAASQVYNARHVVQIAPTSSAPMYSQAGPFSFRLVASDEHQGAFLAKQVISQSPRPRTAIVFVNDDYGRALAGVLMRELHAAGSDPVYSTPYVEGVDTLPDRDEIVAAMAHAKPQLMIWIGRAAHFRQAAHQIRRALPQMSILAGDGFGGPALLHDTLHVLGGVRYVRLVDYSRRDAGLQHLVKRYRDDGFGNITDQAVLAYDAVLLLAQAMREEGTNRKAIRDWIASVGQTRPAFPGLSGPIAFPKGGDRTPFYILDEIQSTPNVSPTP